MDTSASLLERLRAGPDAAGWERFVALYTPLLHGWIRRNGIGPSDADDLVQDVMAVLVRELPNFHYEPARGSFRGWLRTITLNRLRMFWRSRRTQATATGDSDFADKLMQLEDPQGKLCQVWDREHDQFIAQRLLEWMEPEFEPATWQAFRRLAIDGAEPTTVAAEFGLSLNAVYLIKYRVLRRLREEMRGLVD